MCVCVCVRAYKIYMISFFYLLFNKRYKQLYILSKLKIYMLLKLKKEKHSLGCHKNKIKIMMYIIHIYNIKKV